jgi:hypothetical protein
MTTTFSLTTLLDSLAISHVLRERIAVLARQIRAELHHELFLLLRQFRPADLERFVTLWSKVKPGMRSDFVTFIVTGDADDNAFLRYGERDEACQAAVDLAFSAHFDSLRDLGKSLGRTSAPETRKSSTEILSLLCEAERAEEALLSAEEALEKIEEPSQPLLRNLKQARSAVSGTKRGLMALAGISA